jgi:iron complex outermembrane recepter protein
MISKVFFIAFAISFLQICALNAQERLAEYTGKAEDSLKVYKVPSITVTSTRAELGDTPVPFSELTKADLEKGYTVQDMAKLISSTPSVFSYSQNGNDIGYSNLTMRGFDQRRISVMINGIPQNDPEDHQVYWINFPDLAANLENIQVQRGAGMSNYGAAAIGGSINLTTSNYANRKGIRVFSGIGVQQFDNGDNSVLQALTNKQSIEISSGLVDKYAFYARLSRIYSDGYRDRAYADMQSYFLSASRFDENFTTQINIFGGPIRDGLAYTGIPKEYINDPEKRRLNPSYWAYDSTGKNVAYLAERRKEEIEEFSQPHFELLNDWKISDNLTLKSALFYYKGEGFYDYDASWADSTMLRMTSEYGFSPTNNPQNAIVRAYVDNDQGGWIPRLIYNHGKNNELLVGAEIRLHRSLHYGQVPYSEYFPAGYDPDYRFYSNRGERDIFSVFARENFFLTDDLKITAEAQLVNHSFRLNEDKAGNKYMWYLNTDGDTVGNGGNIVDLNFIFFNPRLGANYYISEKSNIFALVAYTSREPRMRNFYAADDTYFGAAPLFEGELDDETGQYRYDFDNPIAKPESMLDIELGWNMMQDEYFINANLYWMEYFDELVKSGQIDIFGNPIDGNAPRTRHYGLELQGGLTFLNNMYGKLDIVANATISQNKIIEYEFNSFDGTKIDLSGNSIAGFPDQMARIQIDYTYDDLYLSLSGKYIGSYFTDNFGDMLKNDEQVMNMLKNDPYGSGYYSDNVLDDYTVFDANIAYTFQNVLSFGNIKLQASINNIFDTIYASGAEGMYFFPGAERNFFFGLDIDM